MNTRFAVAAHILTLIDSMGGGPVSSDCIAGSVHTNPALIRRLLSRLAKAGLTHSIKGAKGGAMLTRPAYQITLAQVHRAVADDAVLIPLHSAPNPQCPVGRHIEAVLESRVSAAEQAMQDELARTTVADLTRDVEHRVYG